jgi:hypothetical protein
VSGTTDATHSASSSREGLLCRSGIRKRYGKLLLTGPGQTSTVPGAPKLFFSEYSIVKRESTQTLQNETLEDPHGPGKTRLSEPAFPAPPSCKIHTAYMR